MLIDIMSTVRASKRGDDTSVGAVCYSSREVTPGAVFFALKGAQVDGHDYIRQAIEAGATCIVAETPEMDECQVAWVQVRDSREAMAMAAGAVHGHPSRQLPVAGVTGTNGKTTIAFLLHYLVQRVRYRCGMLGTVHYDLGDCIENATHTTPESTEIQSLLGKMVASGCKGAVMEVSSHALSQHRVDSVEFDVGIFTNLSQDHLDYHRTMENYFEAKALLGELMAKQGHKKKPTFVINRDDPQGQRLIRRFEGRLNVITYGVGVGSDFRATQLRSDFHGTSFQMEAKGRSFLVRIPLIGRYNVYNTLAVLASASAMKLNLRESVQHIREAPQVPGRLESIDHGGGFKAFVDYAHTPDALQNVLKTLRDLSPNRLICVYGCGGNRDQEKRGLMGQAAEQFSDYSVITSDNPRKEDPKAILDDIVKAYRGQNFVTIEDRREAITAALEMAGSRDIVLIAGKGHEATQQFADRTIEFDDRDEVYKALQALDCNPKRLRKGGGSR